MSLCKYKHIFGKEKEGIHKYRIFDIAIVDVIGTVVIGVIISYYAKWNYYITVLLLFIIAIILHRLFCVNTTINKMIFGIV